MQGYDDRFLCLQVVMTASGDATVRIWNSRDGACVRTLAGHDASVLRAVFLSAGTQVLSTGGDGLMKLWSVRTGECAHTHEAHDDKARALYHSSVCICICSAHMHR